jgi:peroxiredoxin
MSRVLLSSLVALSAIMAVTLVTREARSTPRRERSVVGDTIPAVRLQDVDGKTVDLKARLRGRASILYVYGLAECLGCANLQMEFRVIQAEAPGVQPILIGTGAPRAQFEQPIRDQQLESAALVDENSAFLKALGAKYEPLVLLVTADGHVVYADTRKSTQSARFPMGKILHDLKALVAPAASPSVSSSLGGH